MVTRGVRIVLLVVSLVAAASSRPSRCERSALSIMMQMERCAREYEEEMPSLKALMNNDGLPTMEQIIRYVHDFCTEAIPAGLTCFQDKISGCNATIRAQFSQLAETGVGLLCQPRGGGIDPAMSDVLSGIDDEEIRLILGSHYGRCPESDMHKNRCRSQMGKLPDPESLPLDELVPWMQTTANNYFSCSLEFHRQVKSTCPHWRVSFLVDVELLLKIPLLGVSMSFTPDELTEKLEM